MTIPRKTYTPRGQLLACWPIPANESVGGVVIPQAASASVITQRLLVIAAGPDCKQAKEGDVVLFGETRGLGIRHNDQVTVLIHEDNIAGVVLTEERGNIGSGAPVLAEFDAGMLVQGQKGGTH